MGNDNMRIGWIGAGRMGYAMAERLAKAGADVIVWNRTRAKAEPLQKSGAKIADRLTDLAACDIVFCMVSTWDDVKEVVAGPVGLLSGSGKGTKVATVSLSSSKYFFATACTCAAVTALTFSNIRSSCLCEKPDISSVAISIAWPNTESRL